MLLPAIFGLDSSGKALRLRANEFSEVGSQRAKDTAKVYLSQALQTIKQLASTILYRPYLRIFKILCSFHLQQRVQAVQYVARLLYSGMRNLPMLAGLQSCAYAMQAG